MDLAKLCEHWTKTYSSMDAMFRFVEESNSNTGRILFLEHVRQVNSMFDDLIEHIDPREAVMPEDFEHANFLLAAVGERKTNEIYDVKEINEDRVDIVPKDSPGGAAIMTSEGLQPLTKEEAKKVFAAAHGR